MTVGSFGEVGLIARDTQLLLLTDSLPAGHLRIRLDPGEGHQDWQFVRGLLRPVLHAPSVRAGPAGAPRQEGGG
jgi:hypothetical protein